MTISRESLALASRRVFDRSARVVGWGSGSVFDYFHSLYPVRLDYIVDSDAARWGTTRAGVPIVTPDALAREDAATTFVIVYSSAWPEIQASIEKLGPFASMPASAVFADAATRARLAFAEELCAASIAGRRPSAPDAIVIQGPVTPSITPGVLRATAVLHPNDLIILSTWADTDPELLDAAATCVDEIVVSPRPAAGIQNRNLQIVSTRAGIERAVARGAKTVLKTRSDVAVLSPHVFDQGRWLLDRVGDVSARAAGLSTRIIVPASYTRKFFLYHPSDLVMLGAAQDLLTFWSAPLDPRSGDLLSPQWMDLPVSSVNMGGNPSESYLGLQFARAIGRPVRATLSDSWAFYRDLFAVVDNDWFDLLWLKNLSIPDAALRRGVRQVVTQQFWERLAAHDPGLDRDFAEVDPDAVALRELMGAAA